MSKKPASRTPAINSVSYWDRRFRDDWNDRGGPAQTRFFAGIFLDALPAWIVKKWSTDPFSFMDIGCAQGDASAILSSRFSNMRFIGVDVSAVAIDRAAESYPHAEFRIIKADWSDLPAADYMHASNTIEHLTDWRGRLATLCRVASRAAFVLVPYREQVLEIEHVARFDERTFPIDVEGMCLAYLRVVDTSRLPSSHWNGQQMLAIYTSPELAYRGTRKKARGSLYSGLDLRGASNQEITEILMNIPPSPEAAASSDAHASSDVERVNESWKAKFEQMVESFETRHERMQADHQQRIATLEAQIHASALEGQATSKRLSGERDGALLRSETAERRLAFNDEMNRARLAYVEEVARKEQELQKSLLEIAYAQENLDRERERNRLTSEVGDLRARLRANEDAHAAEIAQLSANMARAHSDAVDNLTSAHAAEIGRLTADLADLNEKFRRLSSESVEQIRYQEVERDRLVDAIDRLTDEKRRLLSTGRAEFDSVDDLESEIERLKNLLAAESEQTMHRDRMLLEQRQHYERHLDSMNRELDRLSSEATKLVERALDENSSQTDLLWAAALQNTRIASTLAGSRISGEVKIGSQRLPSRLACMFRRKRDVTLESVMPLPEVPLPTRLQPVMHMVRHLLDSFRYERNFAGHTPEAYEKSGENHTLSQSPSSKLTDMDPREPTSGLVVAMQLESFDRGGLERVVFDLCSGLSAAGIRVVVLCRSAGSLAKEILEKNIKVITFGSDSEYEAALRENGVTHLFLHHSYMGTDVAPRLGIKIYDVVHNTYFWQIPSPGQIRRVGRSAEAVVCVSSHVRDFHVRAFDIPEAKTRLINNPINVEGLIIPQADQLLQIRSSINQTTFLNVANFYPAKAQIALISAFAQAYRVRPEIRLLIAGAECTPKIADKIDLLIRQHGLQDAVTLLGHRTREDLSRHYAEAHAFLLPSIFEGYSVSAIEAATFGLPLIMTDVGGARDLICDGDCGILLPPIVEDLARVTPEMIDEIGAMHENAVTPFLVEALITVARDRSSWLDRGLNGMGKPRTLPSVVADYLDLIGDEGIAADAALMRATGVS